MTEKRFLPAMLTFSESAPWSFETMIEYQIVLSKSFLQAVSVDLEKMMTDPEQMIEISCTVTLKRIWNLGSHEIKADLLTDCLRAAEQMTRVQWYTPVKRLDSFING